MDSQRARPKITKQRILLVHTGMSYGGIDVYLVNLARLLNRESRLIHILLQPASPSTTEETRSDPVRPFKICRRSPASTWPLFTRATFLCGAPRDRYRLGARGIGTLFLPAARLLGCRAVLTRHCTLTLERLDFFRALKHRIVESMIWRLANCAHKIICVSRNVANDLMLLFPDSKLEVIPNWVPTPIQRSPRRSNGECPLSLLFVGRLERFKGIHLIIDAVNRLNTSGKTTLTIVGDGQYRAELQRDAEGTPTVFTGFQLHPAEFYEKADIFINPSENEGLPLASLEAMSYGIACILSDIPPHREIVGTDNSALLFRSGDAADLSEKLQMCLSDHDLVARLGERARVTASERFSPDAAYFRYAEVLRLGQSTRSYPLS